MAFSRIKFKIFFVSFPGSFRTAVLFVFLLSFSTVRFVFLLRISCHLNVRKKFKFCFTYFRKLHVFARPTMHKSVLCGNLLGKKTLAKEKYITQIVYFLLILSKLYCTTSYQDNTWNTVFLCSKRNIWHHISLKTWKLVPMITIRTLRLS